VLADSLTLERLGFHTLLELLGSRCTSAPGRKRALDWGPLNSRAEILRTQQLITEILHLDNTGRLFSLQAFSDLTLPFRRVRPQDAVLTSLDIYLFLPLLQSASAVLSVLHASKDTPHLREFSEDIHPLPELRRDLKRAVARDGSVLDTASEDLADIRRRIRRTENRLRKKLEDFILRPEVARCLQENFVTNRSGRWVVPVRRDAQTRIPGLVHDLSNSGETAFVEPLETLPFGNELGELRAEERAEELRVLRLLSDRIRLVSVELETTYNTMVELDALMAAARLAAAFGMVPPAISTEGKLVIRGARHPLLWEVMQRNSDTSAPVPLTLELDGVGTRTVVITGPNTGGKTVALKTIGLICLMALSGLHIPADEGTEVPFLGTVAADIGDDQSIEASLSTFSGHMRRISEILEQAGPASLVLLDELGSGTDPEEGGPLACAIVEAATARGGLVVVSTHLGAVKGFVHELPHAMNAAVQFDHRTLQPTFVLEAGVPGRSHALDIAVRYGVPAQVVDKARSMLKGRGSRMDRLVSDLEKLRKSAARQLEAARQSRSNADRLSFEAREAKELFELSKKEMLREAHDEAAGIVRGTRAKMEQLLARLNGTDGGTASLPEQRAGALRRAKKAADEELRHQITEGEKLAESDLRPVLPQNLEPGRVYLVRSLKTRGLLKSLDRRTGRCRVETEAGMDLDISISELCDSGQEPKLEARKPVTVQGPEEESLEPAARELNLIGQRVDPALAQLDRFLSRALLAGYSEVRIVHGLGSGILSRAVREFLQTFPGVSAWRPAERSEGGEGATIAVFDPA